ncbi:MAG: beta-galactosidase [Nibricoccus sp.]
MPFAQTFSRTLSACRLFAGALALSLLSSCSTPTGSQKESDKWTTSTLGLCEDYPEETRSLAHAYEDLELAERSGAKGLRIAFGWDAIEPERGQYDWAFWDEFVHTAVKKYHIRLIPYVCYTPKWAAKDQGENFWRSPPRDAEDFARFMAAIVHRYRDDISSWELWNEPDNPAYWLGTHEEFADLVRAGSLAVRESDPRATIVLGGLAGETDFLEQLFAIDKIAPAVDVVNIHSYFETWHPDPIESLPSYVERAASIVKTYGENEPLWMAETGYSSVDGRAAVSGIYHAHFEGEHTDEAQATALARTFVSCLATKRLPLVAWYRINDLPPGENVIGDDNNRHLGIRNVAGTNKPAAQAFALLAQWFQQPYRVVEVDAHVQTENNDAPNIRGFALEDGRTIVAIWFGTKRSNPPDTALIPDTRHATVTLKTPVKGATRLLRADGTLVSSERISSKRKLSRREVSVSITGGELIYCEISGTRSR